MTAPDGSIEVEAAKGFPPSFRAAPQFAYLRAPGIHERGHRFIALGHLALTRGRQHVVGHDTLPLSTFAEIDERIGSDASTWAEMREACGCRLQGWSVAVWGSAADHAA